MKAKDGRDRRVDVYALHELRHALSLAVGLPAGIVLGRALGHFQVELRSLSEVDARSARGEWRVEGDEYQSRWPGETEWEGWFVMEYAGDWYWVSKATPPTRFKIVDGEQLVSP